MTGMGSVRPPRRAKLFCGLLSGDVDLLAEARRRLARQLGPIQLVSQVWPFDATDYYRDALGDHIRRQFVVFAELFWPAGLRPVNLDPGYLTLSKLVLATTKDYSHRLYLQAGIYAEVTLYFEKGDWRAWPWTYPDYAADAYRAFFREARQEYQRQLSEQ